MCMWEFPFVALGFVDFLAVNFEFMKVNLSSDPSKEWQLKMANTEEKTNCVFRLVVLKSVTTVKTGFTAFYRKDLGIQFKIG